MLNPQRSQKLRKRLETLSQTLPIGWLITICMTYIYIGNLAFPSKNLDFKLVILSFIFSGIFAGYALWFRSLIIQTIHKIIAAKSLMRAIVLPSIYVLIFCMFLGKEAKAVAMIFLIPYGLGLLLTVLGMYAVTANRLLTRFNPSTTCLILAGPSWLGIAIGLGLNLIFRPATPQFQGF